MRADDADDAVMLVMRPLGFSSSFSLDIPREERAMFDLHSRGRELGTGQATNLNVVALRCFTEAYCAEDRTLQKYASGIGHTFSFLWW